MPLAILLSAFLSWLLYRNNPLQFSAKWLNFLLFSTRALLLFLILFLLLGPLFSWKQSIVNKPLLLIAVDNSKSMLLAKDSSEVRSKLYENLLAFKESLKEKFEIREVLFDSKIKDSDSINFTGKTSQMSLVFDEANEQFANEHGGSIVIVSDGIVNKGVNPVYARKELNIPVYTIGIGDTSSYKDLWIHHPRFNELVFEGNKFQLAASVQAEDLVGKNVDVQVLEDGKKIYSSSFRVNEKQILFPFSCELEAGKEGIHQYTIQLNRINGESTFANNQIKLAIQVLKSKQKIVIVYQNPHPDIAAIRRILEGNKNLQIEVTSLAEHQIGKIKEADLYILHQVPGIRAEGLGLIKDLNEAGIPQLYILGAQTGILYLSQADLGLQIDGYRTGLNEVKAWKNDKFSLFIEDKDLQSIEKFPPLGAAFGNYKIPNGAEVLLYQQIGYVKTNYPLWFFNRQQLVKRGFICGEGIWRWKLAEFQQTNETKLLSQLLSKSVQVLAGKDDKSRFKVKPLKRIFEETESIQFEASYFNEAFEPDNNRELKLELKNAQGKKYAFSFTKTELAYQLDAGLFDAGNYTYEASFEGSSNEVKKGSFTIQSLQLEYLNTKADHALLRNLALDSKGEFVYMSEMNELANKINASVASRPLISEQEKNKELIHFKWLFFLLLTLMTLEWFIRKWNGFI
jgi:hypothetical protein